MAGLFKAMLAVLALCCGGEMNRDDDGQWFVQCRVYCILLTVPFFCASYFVRYQFVALNLNFDVLAIFSGVCMGMAAVSRRLCSKAGKIEWMMQSWSRIFHIVNLVRKTVCGRKVWWPLLKIMVIFTGCACFCWLESPWSFKFYQRFVAMWSTAWMHLWDLWGSFAAFVFFHVKAMILQTHASCVSGHTVDGFQATPGFKIPVNCVAQMVDTDFKPTWNHGLLSAVAMMSYYFVTLWQFCSTRPQIAEVVSAVSQWCQQFQFTGRRNSPETPEQKLLQGLQILLKDTLQASSSGASNKKGKGKGSGKSSGKSLPSKQRDANHDGSYGLIQALQKLTARAAKKPQGLLQRLKTLVQVTERGMLRPNKRKKDLPPHEAVPPVKPSTRFKSSENLVDGAPKPKTRWQRDRSWKARAQDWGVKTVLRGPTALCNALDSGDTGALLCQVQNLDDWNEALQISHAAGRTNVTVVLEAAPNMSPELGKLRYHGWTALNTRAAGYADDKLVQRLVWIARCSPNAPTLVPGSVLTGARRPVVQKHGHEAENLVRGFARVKGKDRALQLIKASGSEHKGQVWFLDPARWDGLAETPPRMLWVDKLENEQQIAFARRVAHDSGPFGMARGRVQLALRVKPDDERLKPTSSVWRVETVPFGWDFENVEETLVEAGFSEIDILAKQRRRGGTAWVFKGMRNDDRDQMQIHYDADETCNEPPLDLFLVKQSKRRAPGNVQPLKAENDVLFSLDAFHKKGKGKGKGKGKHKSKLEVPDFATTLALPKSSPPPLPSKDDRGNEAMDVSLISVPDASDVEDEPMHVQGTKRKDQAMLTSPQKTGHDKKRMKVPERLQKVPNPGEGNCLFYCLAQAESTPGKSRSHRQVRAFVVAYMTKHFKKYEDFWDGLSPSNIPMEGGFDDYLQALEKDKAWAGYCEIEAYGEAMRRPVLVVHAKDNVVHAFNSHGDKDVVCLWYKDEHYELIVPSDADIQALWQNAEDGGTKGYRGAAKKARLAADNAPKGATRGDSILRLCKRASVSSDVPHRSILPWKLKHRQMYVQLNKFAKEQGPCGGRTARAEWLAMPGRQKCWRQAPKERQEALHKVVFWLHCESISEEDPDQDWAYFHQFAEKSMREALHLCGQPVPRPLSEPRGLQPDVTVGLAIENMQLQGLPDEWANILMFVWGHQVRWLCLGKAVHPTPEHVQTSMPQGDAFAPLALIMLLIRMPRPGGWQSFICARMRELNWEFRGPWMFAHEDLGHVDLSNPDEAVVKLTEHKVRESWRRVQFALWKKQNRRDRHYLLDVPYEESRVSDARKLFSLTCDSHQRAVMLGSAHSTACYDKMRGHEVREQCPFCGEQIPPVWEHLSWHCSAEQLSSGRPEVPEDELQNRLDWPTRGCDAYDRAVLHHMARVRATVRENMN
ncbi:unnamed protein product [Cladocopium goreaui]|uniref:OTU domain-containing protein 4 n=1 Tax=Cladocopium goreaui TaxID=2562237 RepID=A0A9P1DEJ5_9DINO|nr:unnamed protein product [Cladocopium goreaui]